MANAEMEIGGQSLLSDHYKLILWRKLDLVGGVPMMSFYANDWMG